MTGDGVEVAPMIGWVGKIVVVTVGVGMAVTGGDDRPVSIVMSWQAESSTARIKRIKNLRFIGIIIAASLPEDTAINQLLTEKDP